VEVLPSWGRELDDPAEGIDPGHFRQVMGQYPTGVCIVTALAADGDPVGMTIGSFNAVSLDPPLVSFMPSQTSESWAQLQACGPRFCINILSEGQEEVGRLIAARKVDKFAGLDWHTSPAGMPVLGDSCAYVECTLEQVHAAGDHHIVVGRVTSLDVVKPIMPMLFFRGGYGSFTPLTMSARDGDLVEQLRLVDVVKPVMENLADRMHSEVTVITRVERELVVLATAGRAATAVVPTRVGQRVPFMPPLGGVHAAWADTAEQERWLARLDGSVDPQHHRETLRMIRERGYSFGLGHEANARLEVAITPSRGAGRPGVTEAVRGVLPLYNPHHLDATQLHEFHSATAPVVAAPRGLVFTFTLWGPSGRVGVNVIARYTRELLAATSRASQLVESELDE
jgi:flavin reductase (DIM6/NTAB) family NADH-FMN oxidoreductase RutF/DNA-binding IclR family transcriptional regulator